jgi:hypothetical protein
VNKLLIFKRALLGKMVMALWTGKGSPLAKGDRKKYTAVLGEDVALKKFAALME